MGIVKSLSTAAAGLGLVVAASSASAVPLRAGAALPSASAVAGIRAGQVSEPGKTSSLFRRGRGGPGTLAFVVGGIVLVGILIVVLSNDKGNSPG